jgi:hypothetical protein
MLKGEEKKEHLKTEGNHGEGAWEEDIDEEKGEGSKGGSIGERNRRRERICLARAIPSKNRRRNELGQG